MTSLFDKAVELAGGREAIAKGSGMGQELKRRGVVRTGDLDRILSLPRRRWEEAPDLPALREMLERHLRLPGGEMTLWNVQAAALRDAHDVGAVFGPIGCGQGKALVTLLAPVIMEAERPLLLVPADLREQTTAKVIPEMSRHWRMHPNLVVRGYSELSIERGKDLLTELRPDLIIADEAHRLKNTRSARTRRVARHMAEFPATKFVALSGTITIRSIRDYWHLLLWCLKPELAPLPAKWQEVSEWADALDRDVDPPARVAPGALWQLAPGGKPEGLPEEEELSAIRVAYGKRLTETPGVISTGDVDVQASLRVVRRGLVPPPQIVALVDRMDETWETPGGAPIMEPTELARHRKELALGFWYRWKVPAPIDWLDARKAWAKLVRETIKHNRRGLDSELQVWNEQLRGHGRACDFCGGKGRLPTGIFVELEDGTREEETEACGSCERGRIITEPAAHCEWCSWRAVKASFEPETEPVWASDFAIDDCARWLADSRDDDTGGGICWVEHVAFGERLMAKTGVMYFGAGTWASRAILDHQGPMIASVAAHSEGKNLQRFRLNLITSPMPSGKGWEQLLARTHRAGQRADEVVSEFYSHLGGIDSFTRALADARYLQDTLGIRQRLNYADVVM